MENNESFASHKEEAPIINQLEETIVEWLKSGDENATNLAYQIFFKHIERKEAPASKEKPDFEKMAIEALGGLCEYGGNHKFGCKCSAWISGANRIWNDYAEPQREQVAALQEEIRQLKNKQ